MNGNEVLENDDLGKLENWKALRRLDAFLLNLPTYVAGFYLPTSVTKFDEISPLWQKLKCLWQFYEGLFIIWQKL